MYSCKLQTKGEKRKRENNIRGKIFIVPVQDQTDMENESYNYVKGLYCLSGLIISNITNNKNGKIHNFL